MNYFRFKKLFSIVLLFTAITVLVSSCEKDDDEVPAYVGTWQNISMFDEDNMIQMKETLILKENSFSALGEVNFDGEWIDYVKLAGSLNVSGTSMTLTIKELGISSFDMITGYPTGQIVTYKEGTAQFELIMGESGQEQIMSSEYSVSGENLSVKEDFNEDGDFNDEDEITVYTRVK